LRTLTTQILGAFRLIPDAGVFQFTFNFDQALMLLIVVKDTPEWFRSDYADL
tara:strand:- start:18 stop:173 length:156 start_codon:yes stop_codon:yes gene_type:complete